jgi:hypothetical protein
LNLTGTVNATSAGNVHIQTLGSGVNLGGADSAANLGLTSAEINQITAGTIQIGSTTTGNVTVSSNVTIPAGSNLTMVTNNAPSTGILSFGTLSMGAGKTLDISALPAVIAQINGTTPQTQYSQLNVVGDLAIAGKTLNLSGSYTPVAGDVFVVASATSLTGTFTGQAEGSTITLNGQNLTVNYSPTSVTLTASSNTAPSIISQPTNQTVTAGSSATFTAAASGTPTPTVQWQVSSDGTNWSNVSTGTGGTTNSYTTAALTSTNNGYQYRALYSNSVTANVATNAATVTVNSGATAPTVTGQPSTIGVEVGHTASFTASASGSPAPTVQWQMKIGTAAWTDILNATSTTYSFSAALGDQGNQYRAVFTNSAGTATTNPATLNIGVTPVFTSINYMTIPVGMTSGITVIATGSPAPQYSVTGNLPSGVTLDPVTGLFSGTPASGTAGSYPVTIQATNGIGTAPTQNFTLTVISTVTSFVVSKGSAQRSYIRYLDLGMDSNASALALLNNPSRVKLTKADLNGVGSAPVSLSGFLSVPTGQSTLAVNFGTVGLGNSRNTTTADGYYTLGLDLDGNGTFETNFFFFRILGDTNGDREVSAADQTLVLAGCTAPYNANLDLNGDGVVNTSDFQYVKKSVGKKLKSTLIVTS